MWEYLVEYWGPYVKAGSAASTQEKMNEKGREGWEFQCIVTSGALESVIFKRRLG